MNFLTPHWEYPACVKCAGCGKPLVLKWSNSAIGYAIYHGSCKEQAC